MKAVVADAQARGNLTISEIANPSADSTEALIRVRAFSLNRGEVRRAQDASAGTQIGWDVVGVVETAARDGSGPAIGQRVVGFSKRLQGWAELVALPTRDMAAIPDAVSDADAATLPVAGLTALYCLERCHRLLGTRVLVTGATGGVGYFACQLAQMMGASVTAQLRRSDHQDLVTALGVETIISAEGAEIADLDSFRAIIDGVGGDMLGHLLGKLDERGRAILYGVSAGSDGAIPIRHLMFTGDGRVEGFHLYRESEIESASKGLDRLLTLVAAGRLKTLISINDDWHKAGETAEKLIARDFVGKAVLTVAA
jgi:NADPH:quinone reductase-like Zn-dependent oxidoreductase